MQNNYRKADGCWNCRFSTRFEGCNNTRYVCNFNKDKPKYLPDNPEYFIQLDKWIKMRIVKGGYICDGYNKGVE